MYIISFCLKVCIFNKSFWKCLILKYFKKYIHTSTKGGYACIEYKNILLDKKGLHENYND